jgi:hypothetical protein
LQSVAKQIFQSNNYYLQFYMRLSKHQSVDKSVVLLFPLILWGRRGRDRMVVGLQLPLQSVYITTKVMTSNSVHGEVYSI